VKREYTGGIGKNAYSVYNFDSGGLSIRVFAKSENINRFDEDWKCRFDRNEGGGLKPSGGSE
ncbi:MAG TPA: hypothetical protein VI756_11320, partial [Blastocatellia bacterium]